MPRCRGYYALRRGRFEVVLWRKSSFTPRALDFGIHRPAPAGAHEVVNMYYLWPPKRMAAQLRNRARWAVKNLKEKMRWL
jgi:hypothetical protein